MVALEKSVRSLGEEAFGHSGLKTTLFRDGSDCELERIGAQCFAYTRPEEVSVPAGVTAIGEGAAGASETLFPIPEMNEFGKIITLKTKTSLTVAGRAQSPKPRAPKSVLSDVLHRLRVRYLFDSCFPEASASYVLQTLRQQNTSQVFTLSEGLRL